MQETPKELENLKKTVSALEEELAARRAETKELKRRVSALEAEEVKRAKRVRIIKLEDAAAEISKLYKELEARLNQEYEFGEEREFGRILSEVGRIATELPYLGHEFLTRAPGHYWTTVNPIVFDMDYLCGRYSPCSLMQRLRERVRMLGGAPPLPGPLSVRQKKDADLFKHAVVVSDPEEIQSLTKLMLEVDGKCRGVSQSMIKVYDVKLKTSGEGAVSSGG